MSGRETLQISTRTGVLLLLSVLALSPALYARNPRVRFHHLSMQDGLPHNCVYAITQDSKGFMWFGTYVGLSKYDGYTFTVYKHDPDDPYSLSHNAVVALHEDSRGNLWVGTLDGLNRFDRKTEQFIRYYHDPDNPYSLSESSISAILEDVAGNLWIGTGEGLDRFDYDTGQFIHYRHDPDDPFSLSHNNLFCLYEDHLGKLWIGTVGGGLNRFDLTTDQFTRYQYDPDDPASLSHNRINAIYEDHSATLWIGTFGGGLNRFDRETEQFLHYRHAPDNPFSLSDDVVLRIAEDYAGHLWVGTGAGLDHFDRATERFSHYRHDPMNTKSLNDNRIRALYLDRADVLWIGTKTGGVDRFDRTSEYFPHYAHDPTNPRSLSHNEVYPIYEDHAGILWIGTRGGGLNRFDRATGEFHHYRHNPNDPGSLSHDRVRSIYEDRSETLWIGTDDGVLHQFDRTTEQFRQYRLPPPPRGDSSPSSVEAIYEDRDGTFWLVIFGAGICRFERETGAFHYYQHDPDNPSSLSDNQATQIYEDSSGKLWIGTWAGGLNRFDRVDEQFIRYQHGPNNLQSLSDNHVLSIYEDQQGRFWVGTGRGLNKFDRDTGVVTRYREKDGLPNDTICGILEDSEGNLWLSTNLGISKFHPDKETFKNYDINDGLQGNEFNINAFCQTQDGMILFGGMSGFNAFYPEHITENPHPPPVVLTDFQLFSKSVPIGEDSILRQPIGETDSLTLSHQDFIVGFEFAALNYIVPRKNRYAYIMEGFETDWNEVGSDRRFITYTNVPAGNYVFRVKASNNDGIWNEEGTSIAVTILPPWWETWWFRGGLLIVLTGIVMIGYRVRIHTLKRRGKQLEQQVKDRTKALQQEIEGRKRIEHALRESEARFRSIVETAPSMLHIADTQGKVFYVSPNCEEMTGYTQEELIVSFHSWVHADDAPKADEFYTRAFSEGIGWRNFEYKAVKKNGEIWYASSSWESFQDEDGLFAGIVMQTIDITERKHAEQELHRLYEQARQNAEIKAELLREIHHRVKNNLQMISSLLYFQAQNAEDVRLLEVLQESRNRIKSIAIVHEQLYQAENLAKIEFDSYLRSLTSYLFHVCAVSTETIALRITAEKIILTIGTAIPCALVLNELVTNALKHAFPNGRSGELQIDFHQDGDQVILRIADNGVGMPNDLNIHVVESLGLSLVMDLITKQLHGMLELDRAHGTTFTITFPLA